MATGAVTPALANLRWDLVESQPPKGERLTVRTAMPGRRDDVLIAVDAAHRRYVLVAIPAGEPCELSERTSRGIAVQTAEMNIDAGTTGNFVEIACIEQQGHAALDIVINELVDALDAGASIGRVRLVQNVLAKWRHFWAGVNQATLSMEQHLGLFGELWFLTRWLSPTVGASKAVQMWRGPIGARNDFETKALGIEVKTTSRVDAAHVIHGLEQLLEPPSGSLFLFSLAVRDEASGSENLPRLVDEARSLLVDDFTGLSQLDSALYSTGYDDRHAPEYSKLLLRVRSEGLYRVTSSFPRLIPSSLAAGVPQGISAVSYELRLDAAASWRLATTSKAASGLLADFIK